MKPVIAGAIAEIHTLLQTECVTLWVGGQIAVPVVCQTAGLVFTQRSYSAVYPGTLIARLCRKE